MYVTERCAEQSTDLQVALFVEKYCKAFNVWDLFPSFLFFLLFLFSYFYSLILFLSLQNYVVNRFMLFPSFSFLVFLFINFIPFSTKLCSKQVYAFYSSPNFFSGEEIKENEVSETCDTYREEEKWTHPSIFGRGI